MFLVNTSDQPLNQDEVSSEDLFESRNWEDIEKMLQEKLKQDRREREKEWKSEFLLPVTDSAIPSLSAVAAFPPPVKTSYLLSSDFKEIFSGAKKTVSETSHIVRYNLVILVRSCSSNKE